ncbi:pyridoxamine 5'-phosphate oxidase family protein [Microbacterium sulfonylureivorans]|uniref:pyridoxamine 5'-phosphate oxidase family protein n=1 Tax=Microbacterium sulfonylureivorans TaxID=2486854 RepID=UPI0013DECDE8|nr:pyridoxamine 5'-phosphate oxidase family protein [Microbacterium sulfonylureivorans]
MRCWQLLESATLGRLAIEGRDGHPDMFPVNYLVHNGNVFIRSAPGTKLRSIAKHPAVAFEIDGETTNYHWSVVMHATAHRLDVDADIEASGVLELISASPTSKENFIRLTPETVTGRRFPKRERPGRARGPLPESTLIEGRPGHDLKPEPIPHFAPLRED